ncbi:MAG TPA: tetratricopeptide repeat protein [Spirochaetota bacterium]|nr:MAG: Tetratricopeptide repeat protein [Spirochaetes bacterium ADurb.Bin133]HNZ26435.1 tetratricopeptide repeat protein [Spirochaetota bacterium]HPY88065.1 tetratricopeptide repeat protein [Spirochaetota bacterium]
MKKLIILFIFNISLFNINSLNNDYFSYVVGGVEPDSITSASTKKVDDSDEENSAVNGDGEVLSSKDFFNKSSFFEDAVTGASEKLSDEKENIIDHGANDNKNDYSINATTDSVTTASPGDVESSDEDIDKSNIFSMDTGDAVTAASRGIVESPDEDIDKSNVLSMDTGDAVTAASEIYSETKEDIKEEEYLDSITKGSETVAMSTEKPEDIKVEVQNPNLDALYNKLPEKIKRDILTEDYETKLVVEKKKEFPNEDPVYSMKPNVKKSFYLTDTDIDEAATPEKQIEEEIKETPTPKTEDKQILPEKIREKVAIIDRDIEIAQKEIIIPTIDDVITPDKKEKSFFIDEDTDKPIVEIVEKTEEVVVEKPEEIKSSEKDSKDTIELKIAPQEKRQARDNKSRKTNFIIFSDETSDVVPSLMYDETDPGRILEEEKSEDIAPKNLNELISANPVFKYRENKTIINGRIAISEELALEAHKNALKLFKDNRLPESKRMFEKLIHYNSFTEDSYYYIGIILYLEKKYTESIEYTTEAINSSKSKDPILLSKYYYHIGSVYILKKNYDKSLFFLKKSLDNNSGNVEAYGGIGLSYFRLGDIKNALEYWKQGMDKGSKECKKNYNWLIRRMKS